MPDVGTIDTENERDDDTSDFEAAIEACGFGLFNIFLLLTAIPGLFATIFEIITMSYVLPTAECDLKLTMFDKGTINSMAFAGTIVSALPWGFIADTYGRNKMLVSGLLMNGILTFFSSMSKTSQQLMAFKFFGGFLSSGPAAIILAYVSEFHSKEHRLYILIALGMIKSLPIFILPVLAYIILPKEINFSIGSLEYNSWKLFIAITALPALISGTLFTLFPESPKYLMSQGKNVEALKAFQMVYAVNKRKSKATYPITDLFNEAPEKSLRSSLRGDNKLRRENILDKLKEGLVQIRPLCSRKYATVAIMVYTMYFSLLFSVNSIRLWIPQYFATSKEMEYKGAISLDTCSVLKYLTNKTEHFTQTMADEDKNCEVHIEPDSYIDNIVVSSGIFVTYVFTSFLVKIIGNNVFLRIYLAISSISLMLFYWSYSEKMTLVLASIFVSAGVVSTTLVLNASINVFPTTMRTMAVITILTCGRFGAMLGNIILPHLMRTHCITMFAVFGGSILSSLMTSFTIPNTTKESLK